MSSSFEKYQKRRLISSYFSVVISIALVLFLLGLLGLLVLNTKKIADHFKEQIALTIYLKDTAKEVEIDATKQKSGFSRIHQDPRPMLPKKRLPKLTAKK